MVSRNAGDVFDIFPPRDDIVLVVVLFGTNDSALNHLSLTQHVPIAEYAENLSTIVSKLRCRSKFVVLVTPPCLHEGRRIVHQRRRYQKDATGFLERTDSSLSKYAAVVREVAEYCNVPCLDLFRQTSASVCDGRDFFVDGVHFDEGGQEYFYNQIIAHFQIQEMDIFKVPSKLDCPFGLDMRTSKEMWKNLFRDHKRNSVPSNTSITASEDIISVTRLFIFWISTLLCLFICLSSSR